MQTLLSILSLFGGGFIFAVGLVVGICICTIGNKSRNEREQRIYESGLKFQDDMRKFWQRNVDQQGRQVVATERLAELAGPVSLWSEKQRVNSPG